MRQYAGTAHHCAAEDRVTAAAKTDADRLANIKAFVTNPQRMTEWDQWRRWISDGSHGSLPRDCFESVLDWIRGECEDDD